MRCGDCKYFRALVNYSICEFYDARTKEQNGSNCEHHKTIKFHRKLESLKNEKFDGD